MVSLKRAAGAVHMPVARLQTMVNPLRGQLSSTWLVLLLMLLGLALRVWFISVNELQPQYSPADDGDYYQRALRFATTGQYIDDFWLIRPPLHVMLFALMIRLSILLGNIGGIPLIRAAQTILIVLTIPMGYGLASRLFNQRAGLLFAAILAIWYPLVELPVHLFSEPTFFFCLVLHLWLLVRWRDEQRWTLLVAAGLALGLASLARSPTLYSGAFIVLWLVLVRARGADTPPHERLTLSPRSWLAVLRPRVLRPVLIFSLSCAAAVVPWTVRNYLVYDRFIMIDTIGPVNLWLHVEKYEEKGVEMLKKMPQADRQVFAVEDTRRMFERDPVAFWNLLWRNAGLHFRHIWKAQFAEDFVLKRSFFGRPLRETWPLGAAGDLIWFCFTVAGAAALAAPLREGHFRWIALGWIAYTVVAMMIMHIEPRYLLPVWFMLALYGSWLLGNPADMFRLLRRQHWHGLLAALVAAGLLWLILSYRSYPAIVLRGIARETHNAAGLQAYRAGSYDTARREFQAALEAQESFMEIHANLALTAIAQGRYQEARQIVDDFDTQRMLVVRGALARALGDEEEEAAAFVGAEKQAGEDVQKLALELLPPYPTTHLQLGQGHDLGYILGFSPGETAQLPGEAPVSYRWLQGEGQIVVPLEQPLQAGRVVALRLTAGQPEGVPLTIRINDVYEETILVTSGKWRIYRLPVPEVLADQRELSLRLDAPVFIPAHLFPASVDTRPLSIMVSALSME